MRSHPCHIVPHFPLLYFQRPLYTRNDNYIILLTKVTAAMLEELLVASVKRREFARVC